MILLVIVKGGVATHITLGEAAATQQLLHPSGAGPGAVWVLGEIKGAMRNRHRGRPPSIFPVLHV